MTRPRRFDRNLIVIGAGSAGLVCAQVAARLGASVTLVEAGRMGGDCLNTGCVPSKALIHAARLAADARRAAALGLLPPPGPVDSAAAFRHLHAAIAAVAPHDSPERYAGFGVDVRRGHATLTSPWTVAIDGAELSARAIVLATGAAPAVPDIPGLADSGFLTSETLWELREAPRRLAILGGGPAGCELAQAFARLGSAVTLVQRGPRLLPREDDAVGAHVAQALRAEGVRVLTGHRVRAVDPGRLLAEADGEHVAVGFDRLLVAAGRAPRTEGLGLEALGIRATARGTIAVNAYLQTRHRHILACGDVAGPFQFTHAAGHQGWHAAFNALFGQLHRLRPEQRLMPAVTFTDPEVARIGLTERQAIEDGVPHEVTAYDLDELDRAIVDGAGGFVRVLTPPGRDRILGVTVVAPRAGEMLAEFVLAMRRGVGLKGLQAAIHAYPTYAEASAGAGTAWRAAHVPARALRWLGRYHAWRRG